MDGHWRTTRRYLEEMATCKFTISPVGHGHDCYRVWEALYLGVIPIVVRSPLYEQFSDLPILMVDSWDQVTEEYLDSKYDIINNTEYNKDKLDMDYWVQAIYKDCDELYNME